MQQIIIDTMRQTTMDSNLATYVSADYLPRDRMKRADIMTINGTRYSNNHNQIAMEMVKVPKYEKSFIEICS